MKKRVLVTGGSGFVGRNLVPILLGEGFEVSCLDRNQTAAPVDGCQSILADLGDPDSLGQVGKTWDFVIHLAGATIPALFTGPGPALFNLQITANLLEHLESARVLLVSSCHVYGPSTSRHSEDSLMKPQGFYGLSKAFVEQLAPLYRRKLDIRVARPFNHLGPGAPASLVVPSLLRRLLSEPFDPSVPLEMSGKNSVRDFIDVRDVGAAYLSILREDKTSQGTFNVCTGKPVSIGEVAEALMQLAGRKRPVIFPGKANSSDDNDFMVGDPTLLQVTTGWQARFDLESSLATMIENYSPNKTE